MRLTTRGYHESFYNYLLQNIAKRTSQNFKFACAKNFPFSFMRPRRSWKCFIESMNSIKSVGGVDNVGKASENVGQ